MRRAALAVFSILLAWMIPTAFAATTDAEQATKAYLTNAATCDLFAAESSKLALDKSRDPAIREMATMMLEDHAKSGNRLRDMVASLQMESQLPKVLDKEHQHKLQELREVAAPDFDREYLAMQIKAHEAALQLHQAYANTGPDEPVKAVAADVSKLVEKHLVMLRKLKNQPPAG